MPQASGFKRSSSGVVFMFVGLVCGLGFFVVAVVGFVLPFLIYHEDKRVQRAASAQNLLA